jgi:hypothetical protein
LSSQTSNISIALVAVVLVAAIPLSASAQQQQEDNWVKYEDVLKGLKLYYPADWTIKEGAGSADTVKFQPPENEPPEQQDGYDPSGMWISTEIDISGRITPKEKLNAVVGEFSDREVLEADSLTLGGLPAEQAVYRYEIELTPPTSSRGEEVDRMLKERNPTFGEPMKAADLVAKKDNTFFIVHYEALEAAQWDQLLPTFQTMLESVRIK